MKRRDRGKRDGYHPRSLRFSGGKWRPQTPPSQPPGCANTKNHPVVCSTADGPSNPIAHVLSRHGYGDRYALTAAAVAVYGTLRVARTFAYNNHVEVQNYMKNGGLLSSLPCHRYCSVRHSIVLNKSIGQLSNIDAIPRG